eukprot:Rmarinus@m.28148
MTSSEPTKGLSNLKILVRTSNIFKQGGEEGQSNLRTFVRRRSSIRGAAILGTGYVPIDESDLDNYDDMYVNDIKHWMKKFRGVNPKEKIQAMVELGQLGWIGGEEIQTLIGKTGVLLAFLQFLDLKDEQFASIRVHALQALSLLIQNNRQNQSLLADHGLLESLCETLVDQDLNVRKWTCVVLFNLLHQNSPLQTTAINHPHLIPRVQALLQIDWGHWTHNDALELMRMLNQSDE